MGARAPTSYIENMLQGVPEGERRSLAEVFVRRAVPLLQRVAAHVPVEALKESLSSPTDVGSLARILTEMAGESDIRSLDPLAEAFARGAEIQQELLAEANGAWTVSQVADHLGVSRQAVDKRRKRGTLLAVESAGGYLFPVCQFVETGVLPGLADVLQAMDTTSGWTKLSLLFSETLLNGAHGQTVFEAVQQGEMESALHAARTWGEQGAS